MALASYNEKKLYIKCSLKWKDTKGINNQFFFTACRSGSFGLDCSYTCDAYCKGNESCDPITGICYKGCKEGWSGLMCGKGKDQFLISEKNIEIAYSL